MKLYNKEIIEKLDETYIQQVLNDSQVLNIRVETKMAYCALLQALIEKPSYDKYGNAFIKVDNPRVVNNLSTLANKEVNQEKMNKYIQELNDANFILVNKQDLFIYQIEK